MREIKFRVWNKKQGCMFDDPILISNHNHEVYLNDELRNAIKDGDVFLQYTGLKDKNGVEIFEGDICYCGDILEIVFKNAGFFGRRYDEETSWLCPIVKSFEVVGNIYENPELLEEKNGSI